MINIRKLEKELWESADLLRQGSKLTSNEYCMPVLGLLFLKYAYSRYKLVEKDILKDRPIRNGRTLPIEAKDFKTKSAIFLPLEAQFDYLVNLSDDEDICKAVNNAMELIEKESIQLTGVLPKTYTNFQADLLRELLRIFNNQTLTEVGGDVIGRIYEYFLSKFAPTVASDDGVFFTPLSLVQMIVNVLEPKRGILFDPACGSGGMFVQTGHFVDTQGSNANTAMTFYGQEKVEYNSKLCLMNMAVHGLNGNIKSGDEANTFYNDAHNLVGSCDYVMANPPFNVDKVKSETALNAGRLPFGLPGVNDKKEISNANYLWIEYFYSYLNEKGRAGFVMASSATDSGNKEREIRKQLLESQAVDVMISVGNNFFYTKSLPCTLWFFDKTKNDNIKNKVLFIDSRNYFTVVDRTLNTWSDWQTKNLNAIVWLYRDEKQKYNELLQEYFTQIQKSNEEIIAFVNSDSLFLQDVYYKEITVLTTEIEKASSQAEDILSLYELLPLYKKLIVVTNEQLKLFIDYGDSLDKETVKSFTGLNSDKKYKWQQLKKVLTISCESFIKDIKEIRAVIKDAKWLTDKFGNGVYTDVLGLCKVETIEGIESKNYSLTAGAYVGVAPVIDLDSDNFSERMTEIHHELLSLQAEANSLIDTISTNFEGLEL